jgi:hypothetical protein
MSKDKGVLLLLALLFGVGTAWATDKTDPNVTDLQTQIEQVQQQMQMLQGRLDHQQGVRGGDDQAGEQDEAALLRQLAEEMAGDKPVVRTPEETVFKSAGLSLQKLNPEISASGDFVASWRDQSDVRRRTDAEIRGLELNIQSYLDPFSYLKATVHMTDDEIDVEEIYMTRFSVLEGINLDLGKFRQQFGVVNRWHGDALDQVHYPLALQNILGEEGLGQTGASLETLLPQWGAAHQALTLQVTAAENEHLFSEEKQGLPSLLYRYKNYRDLNTSTYLEFGLSGLFGWNDTWDIQQGAVLVEQTDTLGTRVFGVDLSVLWEPLEKALYRNLEWRSELYILNRDMLAPDASGRDTLNAWGCYSYIQGKINRRTQIGIRGDYYRAESKPYAEMANLSLAPLAYTSKSPYRWQVVPYLTWWQSEFVKFRAEYDYANGKGMEPEAHSVWLQAIFAVGPHKHERY